MLIEVTGTSIWNKGAELMFIAIRDHLSSLGGSIDLAVDFSFGPYPARAKYGLYQKVDIRRVGRSRLAHSLMPKSFRRSIGLVGNDEVDAILDASGFAFGDQHPLERTEKFADQVENWANKGKPVVLLPQALGPFQKPGFRDAFRRIADAADLIYAREEKSYQYAVDAAGSSNKIKLAPDFTNLVKPVITSRSIESDRICLVPNHRMLEKATHKEDGERYIDLMVSCASLSIELSKKPVIVLHGTDDEGLADEILGRLGYDILVIQEKCPVGLKKIIGESHLVIGSRFHALVSALSQGVPAMATSWSHKYEQLFEDYGCREMVLPITVSEPELKEKMRTLIGVGSTEYRRMLEDKGREQVARVVQMWKQVDKVLGLNL